MLKGRSVLVTGSTSGIGWGIVTQFAKAGARVMFHGLEAEKEVSHLKTELVGHKAEAVEYTSADLSSESACKDLVERSRKLLGGKLDIIVNNAGIQYTARCEDYPTDKYRSILAICLDAPFFISKAALPHMYEQKWGRLIHIGSAHSHVASPNKTAYCAAKHGVLGLSRAIALESAGKGVTSNCVCPGWVRTPLVQKQVERIAAEKKISLEEAQAILVLDKHPVNEFVEPENLGAFCVFLASEPASQINGASLSMDLGWTVR